MSESRFYNSSLGIGIDFTNMQFQPGFRQKLQEELWPDALREMKELESGAIANPDEKRMVGHYWLRKPEIAPEESIQKAISETVLAIEQFAEKVRSGSIKSETGKTFRSVLLIGIGGSALGPQFVTEVFKSSKTPVKSFFFDNTDPDGFDSTLASLGALDEALVLVISKSGATKETRNGMLAAKAAFEAAGVSFSKAAVAITGEGSQLVQTAKEESWLEVFPMWDWVGGRTSELSAVGLLLAALQGVEIRSLLAGAAKMDELTRQEDLLSNPGALLAASWLYAARELQRPNLVILPYKDRLQLFSRYLQQLIMESLGKKLDRDGKLVEEGICVFGNKGSTDQHAFVQQLRDGLNNFVAIFIHVLKDTVKDEPGLSSSTLEVEPGVFAGDYLHGFFLGTRSALTESDRLNLTISLDELHEESLGALIALFERAVSFYASFTNINAYHQPGVEAGKKAAQEVIKTQNGIFALLEKENALSLKEIAQSVPGEVEEVLRYLQANRRVRVQKDAETVESKFSL